MLESDLHPDTSVVDFDILTREETSVGPKCTPTTVTLMLPEDITFDRVTLLAIESLAKS